MEWHNKRDYSGYSRIPWLEIVSKNEPALQYLNIEWLLGSLFKRYLYATGQKYPLDLSRNRIGSKSISWWIFVIQRCWGNLKLYWTVNELSVVELYSTTCGKSAIYLQCYYFNVGISNFFYIKNSFFAIIIHNRNISKDINVIHPFNFFFILKIISIGYMKMRSPIHQKEVRWKLNLIEVLCEYLGNEGLPVVINIGKICTEC